jgi:hypothetical protein
MPNVAAGGANRQIGGTHHGHRGHFNRESFGFLSSHVDRMSVTEGDENKERYEDGKKPEGRPQ